LLEDNKDNVEYLKTGFKNLSKKLDKNFDKDFESFRDLKNLVGELKYIYKLSDTVEDLKTQIN